MRVINKKNSEIKNRSFGPNPYKQIRETDRNNPDSKFYSLSLAYTSHLCSKIASNLKQITKNTHLITDLMLFLRQSPWKM